MEIKKMKNASLILAAIAVTGILPCPVSCSEDGPVNEPAGEITDISLNRTEIF
jgi:hypothetical protein